MIFNRQLATMSVNRKRAIAGRSPAVEMGKGSVRFLSVSVRLFNFDFFCTEKNATPPSSARSVTNPRLQRVQFDPAAQSVGNVMTAAVVTVQMDESLEVIQEIFDHARFHHLLVMDGHTLTGIISGRDALKALSPYVGTISETHRDRAINELIKSCHIILSSSTNPARCRRRPN